MVFVSSANHHSFLLLPIPKEMNNDDNLAAHLSIRSIVNAQGSLSGFAEFLSPICAESLLAFQLYQRCGMFRLE